MTNHPEDEPARRGRIVMIADVIATVIAIGSFIVSLYSLNVAQASLDTSERISNDSNYVVSIEKRIEACLALADFHRRGVMLYPEENTPCNIKDTKHRSSSGCRIDQSANLSRALTLCLAKDPSRSALETCVKEQASPFKVWDDGYGADGKGTELNPAC